MPPSVVICCVPATYALGDGLLICHLVARYANVGYPQYSSVHVSPVPEHDRSLALDV